MSVDATVNRGRRLPPFGTLLRGWRRARGLSQLALALEADTSARHLSCVETGKARPSRPMVLRLAEHLDVPLRERNDLLQAAGYAPEFRESGLDDANMAAVRGALDTLLAGHEPYPGVVVDRQWNLVAGNGALAVLTEGVTPELLHRTPVNVVRLALHPDGLAARCVNLAEVRGHFLDRVLRQANATGDPGLRALYEEVRGYGGGPAPVPGTDGEAGASQVLVPLRFRTPHGELSMFSTMATFGAPADITLSELAIELFFPADAHTERVLRDRASG
ncbi:helix-turn-helix transcriptional regulator [Streptomyces sp. HNM0574]|uniref:helix-turn-helix domain-containing protein n=1 Tax=Streptomyces sp. HNM0574 TaxID=2714954 RepID=UPI00146E675F|nr:helix-turn-helix transcriptional regulator [Streptomyces sp. HNM0574]NLU68974.1 helix-turn-helix transcriptional regulator [Streptomyces sp. HNM0574]